MYQIHLNIYQEVMDDPRLRSLEEKILVCFILGFQNNGKQCFASNRILMSITSLSEPDLIVMIHSLKERGILKINYGNSHSLEVILDDEQDIPAPDIDLYAGL